MNPANQTPDERRPSPTKSNPMVRSNRRRRRGRLPPAFRTARAGFPALWPGADFGSPRRRSEVTRVLPREVHRAGRCR